MDHRWLLCVCVLTDILVLSESADLQVLIDDINVGRSASCTGENVTYVCTISSTSHSWTINNGAPATVIPDPLVIDERYTVRLVSFNEVVVSSHSVTSFEGLNGVNLTCADGRPISSPPTKKAVAMVLAPPSLPELNVSQVMEDNETVHIMVTPPSVSPECVLQYNIITYSNCEGIENNITVDPNTDPTQPVQLTRSGLNLCTCSYNFTAVAVTRNGIGERTNPVTIKISAPPSLPELDVSQEMEDNETVYIMVTPPSVSPECVLQYIIIIYSNCEGIETNITVDPNTNPTQPVQLIRGSLNLCTCSYNFTASAVTRNGIGERSNPVTTIKISDIVGNPDLTITNDGFKVGVLINPQEPSVFVDVKRSSANDTNCVVNVERNRNITSSETTLDCSFAELTPTFCVQLIDGSCQSELVQRTTSTKLPSLLSGVTITSPTSSIVVIVDVNEAINCDTSQLSTRTTISDESGVVYMDTGAFTDQVIIFEPPSPGVYTCNVSIMSGNAILKSMEEPCSNIVDTRSTSQTSTSVVLGISISITFIVSFLLGFSLRSLLTWCLSKRNLKKSSNQQPSSGPEYEIVSPQTNTIELESNKAYGYVK